MLNLFLFLLSRIMASLPCSRTPCVPRRLEAQPRARTVAPSTHRARQRRAKKSPFLLVVASSSSPKGDAPPPLTDDIDALISALAKTTLAKGIDERELFKLLRPSSSSSKTAGEKGGGAAKGGAAAAATTRAASPSLSTSTASTKRKLGPAELLKNLLAASAPDAEAAATGTVRLLQSLDDDDDDAAFASYEEDYESDGESSTSSASASTSSADFSAFSSASSDAVGPRLRAELGALVLKAFETAAGATASSFPDAARAASRGRLTREPLAALLGRSGGDGGVGGTSTSSSRDVAAVDDLLLRFGLRDSSSGELYLGYAGFLKLLASEVADLRAVYAQLESPAAVAETEASSSSAAVAASPPATSPTSPPAAATSSDEFTFRPGTVSLVFGGEDVDAACASAGPGGLVCVQAGFTW